MTSFFYQQYFFIFLFFFISILLSFILLKANPYEDARQAFGLKFYLLYILFIMFDLEAVYWFGGVISLNQIYLSGFWLLSFISIYSYMHVFFHLLILKLWT